MQIKAMLFGAVETCRVIRTAGLFLLVDRPGEKGEALVGFLDCTQDCKEDFRSLVSGAANGHAGGKDLPQT